MLHCFTGCDEELDECLALGLHIGVTGWLCDERRGQLLREQVARIPAGRLMIETDAPYLVPRDLKPRPKRNEPAFLPHIAQVVAACRGEAPEALLAHTRAHLRRVLPTSSPGVIHGYNSSGRLSGSPPAPSAQT